jgi:hypothetical protein
MTNGSAFIRQTENYRRKTLKYQQIFSALFPFSAAGFSKGICGIGCCAAK